MLLTDTFYMREFIKKHKLPLIGALAGMANGLFGAGGGMICVFLLTLGGEEQAKAQAESVSITVFLSAVSAAVYLSSGGLDIAEALKFVPLGLLGAAMGAKLLKSASPKILKLALSAVMIYSGIRLVM